MLFNKFLCVFVRNFLLCIVFILRLFTLFTSIKSKKTYQNCSSSFSTLVQVSFTFSTDQTMTLSERLNIICSFLLSYLPFSQACDISTAIVNDWNIANHLNDWTLCYYQPYKHITSTSDLTACPTEPGYYVFIGAKATQVIILIIIITHTNRMIN